MAIHPKPLPDPFDLIKDQLFYNRSTVNYTNILDETEADYHDQTTNVNPVQKTLSWTDITAKTTLTESKCSWLSCCGMKKGETTNIIINKVSGIAKAQSFLGIIGSSGSGKTTLLNCITQRNLGSLKVEGQCFVNGENIGEDICRISGYVQQDNIYIGILTVKEHLWFNAVLRLQQNSMDSDRQKRIEYVMDEMGLTKCQNTTIGIPGSLKGISGGEKKRLAFATELLTIPNILICDEPTSGLDSFTAHSVVQSLKNLATKGHTILATIHQPSPEVFSMFDDILIMTGGRVVFLGSKSDAMAFFSGLGYHCPKTCSVTDFFMETLAIIPGREKQSQGNNVNICQRFEESDYSDVIKRQIHEQLDACTHSSSAEPAEFSNRISKRMCEANWFVQFRICFWRSQLELRRHKERFPALFIKLVVLSLLIGSVYWNQAYDSVGLVNINAALFMMMLQTSLNMSPAATVRLSSSFNALVKEHYDSLYSVSAFYFAVVLTEVPATVLGVITYTACSYWMIGLYSDAGTFFAICGALIILTLNSIAIGHLAGSIFRSPDLALMLYSFVSAIQLIISGFLMKGTLHGVLKIVEMTSSFHYAYQIMVIAQWRNVHYLEYESDDEAEGISRNLNGTSIFSHEDSTLCYHSGLEIIKSYGYELNDIGYCFGCMIALLLATEILSGIALIFKVKRAK